MHAQAKIVPVVILLALAVGGPVSSSAATDPRVPKPMTFKEPVMVSANDDQTAGEPSIRSAPDGTLYIVAPSGLGNVRTDNESGGGDIIWRSGNGGKTWKFLGSLDNQQGGGDADVAVDTNGIIWGAGLTLANTTASISTDKGENFNVNPIGSLATGLDRQWIETYKDQPFAFLTTGEITNNSVILSRLERVPGDYPAVSNTVTVSGDDVYQWPGEIAVDEKSDHVYVAYNTAGGKHDDIKVARTDLSLGNLALSKVTTTKGDTFDSFVGMDVDRAGNVYVTWTERRPAKIKKRGRTPTYVAMSKNRGATWSPPLRVNKRANTTTFPWLVAGSKGRVAIAYYGIRQHGESPEKVVYPKRPSEPRWKVWVAYSLNADSANPTYIEKRATGRLHEGNVCTSGTGCAPGTRDLLDFFQVDLNPCGRVVITYTDNSRDEVTKSGERTLNKPELIAFVKQASGPRLYGGKAPAGAKC